MNGDHRDSSPKASSPEALEDIVFRWPGSFPTLADAQVTDLANDPPTDPILRARTWAEVLVRIWLYEGRGPAALEAIGTRLMEGRKALATAFEETARTLRRPDEESEPAYSEVLSGPDTTMAGEERQIWEALKSRLKDFLECDGLFLLYHENVTEAVALAFSFRSEAGTLNKVFDSAGQEIKEWSALLEKLPGSHPPVGVQIRGECPIDFTERVENQEIGSSIALPLVLGRERRSGQSVGWYGPLDVAATGAFRDGLLSEVKGEDAKRRAALRAGCRLVIWAERERQPAPSDKELPLPLKATAAECVKQVATRLRAIDHLTFHRACLCVQQIERRRIRSLTDVREVQEIVRQLEQCRPLLEGPNVPAKWRSAFQAAWRAAKAQNFWLRSRLSLAVAATALVILAVIWSWQEHRKMELARLARIARFTEQGRQELLMGSPLRALPYLSEAYQEGGTGTALRLLLAEAVHPLDSLLSVFGGPADPVGLAAFNPEGSRLITTSVNHSAQVWDTANGNLLLTLEGDCDPTFHPSFSPDGTRIVTARGKSVKVWSATDGKLLASLDGHKFDVKTAVFSPDGTRIVTASVDDTAKVWSASDGALLISLTGHAATVTSAAFSPDGTRVLTISADDTAKVWEVASGRQLFTLPLTADGMNPAETILKSGSFSPDGRRILTVTGLRMARLWDASRGKLIASLDARPARLVSARFSPDGTHVFAFTTSPGDNKVSVWDIESLKVLTTLEGHKGWINTVELNRSGSRFITAGWDGTVMIWDAASGKSLATLEGHRGFVVVSATYSPDNTRILTIDGEGYARVWDATGGKLMYSFRADTNGVSIVRFSADQSRLATASPDRIVRVWETGSGRQVAALTNFACPVTHIALNRSGTQIATASGFGPAPARHDDTVRLWDVGTGQLQYSLNGHSNAVSDVVFSSDGRRILTRSDDNTVKLWQASGGALIATFIPPPTKRIVGAACNSDATKIWVATYAASNPVEVWDFAKRRRLCSFAPPNAFFSAIVFSRDGSRILTTSADLTAMVWDRTTGSVLTSLEGEVPFGAPTAWSADDSYVFTGSGNGGKVWDAATGKLLTSLEGHITSLTSCDFSADGTQIVTASSDGMVKVWNLRRETRSREKIARLAKSRGSWQLAHGELVPAVSPKR